MFTFIKYNASRCWFVLSIAMVVGITTPAQAASLPAWHQELAPQLAELASYSQANHMFSSRVDAQQWQTRSQRTLPDPMIGVGIMSLPTNGSLSDEMMTQAPYLFFRQEIPFPSKIARAVKLGEIETQMVRWQQKQAQQMQALAALENLFLLQQIVQKQALLATLQDWLKAQLARERSAYANGMSTLVNVNTLEISNTKIATELAMLAAQAATAKAYWQRFTGLPAPTTTNLSERIWAPPANWLEDVLMNNPEIKMAETQTAFAHKEVDQARANFAPDLMLEFDYGVRQAGQRDLISAMLGITVPLWAGGHRQQVKASKANAQSQTWNEADVRADIATQTNQWLATQAALAKQIALYQQTLLPASQTTFSATKARYGSGQADSIMLAMALDAYTTQQQLYYQTIFECRRAEAMLLALAGQLWQGEAQ